MDAKLFGRFVWDINVTEFKRNFKKIFSKIVLAVFGRKTIIAVPYAWLIVFSLLPCIVLYKISLSDPILASPPYTDISAWNSMFSTLLVKLNFSNYIALFTDEIYIRSLLSSLGIAATSTFFCFIIGFPMAYAIARSDKKVRGILLTLVVLPFWTSFLIRVYACILLLSPAGIINNILIYFGIIAEPLRLINSTGAACFGMVYTYLPFMILPLYSAIEKIDFSILEAAYDLGASPMRTLFSVTIPLTFPGIVAGSSLVFIPAIGEFVIPELLGGAQTLTIGRVVWNEFFGNLSWPMASALAIFLLVFIVLPSILYRVLKGVNVVDKR